MKKKVIVGMSGGVDSSVCACLLKNQGYEVIGVTVQTWQENEQCQAEEERLPSSVEDARRVAHVLGIPHYVVNFQKEFKHCVTDYFVEEYLQGRTPNPCIVCNRCVKWEALLKMCKEMEADYVATGHYARIEQMENKRFSVKDSESRGKDQTYALYSLTQEQLSRTLMPLGAYTKEEIRHMAEEYRLPVAHKPDSQEICFIPDNDYAAFIDRMAGERVPSKGNFVTVTGQILGEHKGITHYTVGQRKGLHLSLGHPVFVVRICPETNEVVVGEGKDVYETELVCGDVNYMAVTEFAEGERVWAKIRYAHKGAECVIIHAEDGMLKCTFETPVRAVTPGQAVVFYRDGYVLGGGTIRKSRES